MSAVLFVGNGLNHVDKVAISWNKLLDSISAEDTNYISESLGMTLRFEYIDAVSKDKALEIKRKVAKNTGEKAEEIKEKKNSLHVRLMKLPIQTIITTNYDYALELSADASFVARRTTVERLYSFYRKQTAADKTVYHIHGECRYPNSICLGFEHYAGMLEKMRSKLVLSTSAGNPDKRFHLYDVLMGLTDPDDAWYYNFFKNDIYFLGFGFDSSEEDIWWLITYRRRLKELYPNLVKNRLVFLDTTPESKLNDPKEKAKRAVLKAMDVQIEKQKGRTYREKAISAVKFLEQIENKEAPHV